MIVPRLDSQRNKADGFLHGAIKRFISIVTSPKFRSRRFLPASFGILGQRRSTRLIWIFHLRHCARLVCSTEEIHHSLHVLSSDYSNATFDAYIWRENTYTGGTVDYNSDEKYLENLESERFSTVKINFSKFQCARYLSDTCLHRYGEWHRKINNFVRPKLLLMPICIRRKYVYEVLPVGAISIIR